MAIYKNIIANALNGGAARALDSYLINDPVKPLLDKDIARVFVGGNVYFFRFDSTATDVEDVAVHPYKVRPDDFSTAGVWIEQVPYSSGGGSGTVTSVSVVTANGISGSVANPTTTPAITLTLGAITPSTVNGLTLTAQATGFTIAGGTTSKTLTVPLDASVSGTNTGDNAYWTIAATVMSPTTAGNTVSIPLLDIQQTATDALNLNNPTLATAGVTVQYTPALLFSGNVWKSGSGATNYPYTWRVYGISSSASSPGTSLVFSYNINNGSYFIPVCINSWGVGNTISSYGFYTFGTSAASHVINRNRSDAVSVVAINNINASSTGNILDLQWQTVNRLCVTKEGNLSAPHADGIKIGITASEKIAFWGLTPMAQPAAIANATGSGDAHTQLNLLLAQLRLMGLIAAA